VGKRSPASARGVARLLTAVLLRVEILDLVNDAIAKFLEQN